MFACQRHAFVSKVFSLFESKSKKINSAKDVDIPLGERHSKQG